MKLFLSLCLKNPEIIPRYLQEKAMESQKVKKLREKIELIELKNSILKRYSVLNDAEPENNSLWMMLDLMTLLLIFFIYLYSLKINHHYNITFATPAGVTPIEKRYESREDDRSYKHLYPDASFVEVEKELLELISDEDDSDYSVEVNSEKLVLVIGEKISFKSGDAKLLPEIEPVMKKVSNILSKYKDYHILVSGHTDNRPINSRKFPSNWELSAIRAINVAKALIKNDLSPKRISIEGYAEFAPRASNFTAKNRQENRRVEISLVKRND
jgi:chemotaxis protein MotB